MPSKKVVITNAALDEQDGELVWRGVIDPDSLRAIDTPSYQREVLTDAKITKLMDGHRKGRVPDVELNMRGQRFNELGDGIVELLDPVFMVDGLQRITSGIRVMHDPESPATPRIGATIHIDRDEAWERERFEVLNLDRTKLSPNVHLRNMRVDSPAVAALFRLTRDTSFVLRDRVQWGQNARKSELMSATTYVKTVARLHSYFGPGRGSDVRSVVAGLDQMVDSMSRKALADNARTFFELIDECWGIADIEYKQGATVLKATFLAALANVLGSHEDFWVGEKFQVAAPMRAKLKRFNIKDPTIRDLAGSSGAANDVLYDLMVKHINSGRRTGHLRPRSRANGNSFASSQEVTA